MAAITYHDATRVFRVMGHVVGWTCEPDGGWAFQLFGLGVWRMSRDEPVGWTIGPFVTRNNGLTATCSISFIPAWHNLLKAKL